MFFSALRKTKKLEKRFFVSENFINLLNLPIDLFPFTPNPSLQSFSACNIFHATKATWTLVSQRMISWSLFRMWNLNRDWQTFAAFVALFINNVSFNYFVYFSATSECKLPIFDLLNLWTSPDAFAHNWFRPTHSTPSWQVPDDSRLTPIRALTSLIISLSIETDFPGDDNYKRCAD